MSAEAVAKNRVNNLRLLVKSRRGVPFLNAAIGRPRGYPYFYQILRGEKNRAGGPARSIGPAICAELEKALGLPAGWMDAPHDAAEPEKPASLPHQIPLLSAAGESFLLDPHLAEGLSIEHPAAFIVADDSMAPRFLPGDILVIDLDETAIKPGFFIIESEGAAILRKIGTDVVGRRIIMADGLPGMIAPAAGIKILGAVRRCFRPVRP